MTPRQHREGIRIAIFVKILKGEKFNLVMIKRKSYYIYTYLGKLKGIRRY